MWGLRGAWRDPIAALCPFNPQAPPTHPTARRPPLTRPPHPPTLACGSSYPPSRAPPVSPGLRAAPRPKDSSGHRTLTGSLVLQAAGAGAWLVYALFLLLLDVRVNRPRPQSPLKHQAPLNLLFPQVSAAVIEAPKAPQTPQPQTCLLSSALSRSSLWRRGRSSYSEAEHSTSRTCRVLGFMLFSLRARLWVEVLQEPLRVFLGGGLEEVSRRGSKAKGIGVASPAHSNRAPR